ncbi:efflux RND transporter periplasmic adaptor subunit [Paraburkholderia sp. DHOC27]|uniref:efflux RND transporter periplasmic adaptor subunit n=1 Tax=Paraburkholderia sp. DHOC27 TaxID=2303330 RepID=UPI000E3BE075|nr:efflux RND transporter periplasmic adaptor subunit [Paraburkholderia sp. DHOC27]RFU46532.1 efflux RND transporter periplasmic adaptor subunit [Paraburkholderia sp. DHOC27]
MKKTWFSVGQILLTLVVVVIAGFALWKMVDYYMFSPWTRDGRIRADIIQVAPDISGLITEVDVNDNQQVKAGETLFVIDQARYTLALRTAEATVQQRRATLDQARREDVRNHQLGDLVAREIAEESRSRVEQGEAALADALVAVDTAKLNLQRTNIVSPVDGYLNDRAPRVGEFAAAGRAVLSVVDMHSFRVDGYFEETKLSGIDIGQGVDIKVMGEPGVLRGHVQSIVAGIEDRDRTPSSNLLPNVNPAFSWVRLAQRIPVRVALDDIPKDFRMIAGRTATVSVRGLAPSIGPGFTSDRSSASGVTAASAPAASVQSSATVANASGTAVMPVTSAASAAPAEGKAASQPMASTAR